VVDRLRALAGLGVDGVLLYVHLGGLTHEQIMSSLDLFAREVLPAVREL
jgi:hypothetical protein